MALTFLGCPFTIDFSGSSIDKRFFWVVHWQLTAWKDITSQGYYCSGWHNLYKASSKVVLEDFLIVFWDTLNRKKLGVYTGFWVPFFLGPDFSRVPFFPGSPFGPFFVIWIFLADEQTTKIRNCPGTLHSHSCLQYTSFDIMPSPFSVSVWISPHETWNKYVQYIMFIMFSPSYVIQAFHFSKHSR